MTSAAPAIPVENLYYLFCYAWNRFEEARTLSTDAEVSPDLPNLLAKVLSAGTRSLLRRGLDRGYVPYEEELSTVRGQIQLGSTLRLHARNARRLHCAFDELSHDLLHNRLLKASLRLLSRAQALEPELARALHTLAARMPDVSDMRLSAAAFTRVHLHRNNARYDLLLRICRLAFECLIPVENGSGYAFQDVLRDERRMARVFEDFVRNFYRTRQREFSVKALRLDWQANPVEVTSDVRLPGMLTDVYLESRDRRIILDTKYYVEALQEYHGGSTFRSDNLYQLFAYLRNAAVANPDIPAVEGMLLYPEVYRSLDATYSVHGHSVRFATVDLARPWREIEARLNSLLLPFKVSH